MSNSKVWVLNVYLDMTVLSTVQDPKFVPVENCCVTTEDGTFTIHEVAIDYRLNEISCYTSTGGYDLR